MYAGKQNLQEKKWPELRGGKSGLVAQGRAWGTVTPRFERHVDELTDRLGGCC